MVLTTSEAGKILTMDDLELSLYTYKAKCRRVVDGDTLDLDLDLGLDSHRYERVRLYGIDTPETYGVKKDSEEYAAGKAATDLVRALLFEDKMDGDVVIGLEPVQLWVETHRDKTGKYGRYLATVWFMDGDTLVSLNELLVSKGLAEAKVY